MTQTAHGDAATQDAAPAASAAATTTSARATADTTPKLTGVSSRNSGRVGIGSSVRQHDHYSLVGRAMNRAVGGAEVQLIQ